MNNQNNQSQQNTPKHHDFAASILSKIKSGEVKMHSKAYFMTRFLLGIGALICLFLLAIIVASFVLFTLRATGILFFTGFGVHGITIFFLLFPWKSLLLLIILLLGVEIVLKHFSMGYSKPIMYTFGGLIVVVVGIGIVVFLTPVHRDLLQMSRQQQLPPFANTFYSGIGTDHMQQVYSGTVEQNFPNPNNEFDLHTRDHTYQVMPAPGDELPPLQIGDFVLIGGNPMGNTIQAFGLKILGSDENQIHY